MYTKIGNGTLCNSLPASKNCDRNGNRSLIQKSREKNDKGNIRNIQIKCMITIIVKYTITEKLPFIVQSHKN